jgi:hypothetical protein
MTHCIRDGCGETAMPGRALCETHWIEQESILSAARSSLAYSNEPSFFDADEASAARCSRCGGRIGVECGCFP